MSTKPTAQELRELLPNISEDNLALNASDSKTTVAGNTRTHVLGAVAGKGDTITGRPSTGLGQQNKTARIGNKYHVAAKADRTYRGTVYDSKKEMQTAQELDLLVKAGELTFWLRQVPFVIGFDPLTIYRADFVTFKGWTQIVSQLEAAAFPAPLTITETSATFEVTVIEVKPKSEKAWAPGAKRKLKLFRAKYPNLELKIV